MERGKEGETEKGRGKEDILDPKQHGETQTMWYIGIALGIKIEY